MFLATQNRALLLGNVLKGNSSEYRFYGEARPRSMSLLLTPQEKLIIPHFVLLKHSPYTLIIVHSQNTLLYFLSDCVCLSL